MNVRTNSFSSADTWEAEAGNAAPHDWQKCASSVFCWSHFGHDFMAGLYSIVASAEQAGMSDFLCRQN